MLQLLGTFLLTLACASLLGPQDHKKRSEAKEYFVEPRESVLPVLASQPSCPLELANLEFHHYKGGGGVQNYTVRNRSAKPIIRFVIATVSFAGGGSLDDIVARSRNEWLVPGESWPRKSDDLNATAMSITDDTRSQYGIGPPMKGIVIYLVVRVEFSDGSIYDDEPMYRELKALFENILPSKVRGAKGVQGWER